MRYPLSDAYPRRWRGYQVSSAVRPHDYTSLESLVTRRGSMSNPGGRPVQIRDMVLRAIPYGRFTCAAVYARLPAGHGITLDAVRRLITVLINDGHPITRVVGPGGNTRKPATYINSGGVS